MSHVFTHAARCPVFRTVTLNQMLGAPV